MDPVLQTLSEKVDKLSKGVNDLHRQLEQLSHDVHDLATEIYEAKRQRSEDKGVILD